MVGFPASWPALNIAVAGLRPEKQKRPRYPVERSFASSSKYQTLGRGHS
jgi:hypothetical protein